MFLRNDTPCDDPNRSNPNTPSLHVCVLAQHFGLVYVLPMCTRPHLARIRRRCRDGGPRWPCREPGSPVDCRHGSGVRPRRYLRDSPSYGTCQAATHHKLLVIVANQPMKYFAIGFLRVSLRRRNPDCLRVAENRVRRDWSSIVFAIFDYRIY